MYKLQQNKKMFFAVNQLQAALILCILSLFLLSSCRYTVQTEVKPLVDPPSAYTNALKEDSLKQTSSWWEDFNDTSLNSLVSQALQTNFSLKEVLARLDQARAEVVQEDASLYPLVEGVLAGSGRRDDSGTSEESISVRLNVSWEIDLWNRLSAAQSSVGFELMAAASEAEAIAFLLSTQVADTYFHLVEQNLQLQLLKKQVATGTTFLSLIKLRFANGSASIVDVYQQRQQLASINAQIPLVRARMASLQNRLSVLLGQAPGQNEFPLPALLPELPPLPSTGVPADLLLNRPDLSQKHQELIAADYKVAEAVADRLPRLRLGASSGLQGESLGQGTLFFSVLAEAVATVFDWGKRKAEVEKRKAEVNELLAAYTQAYLVGIAEVENGLSQERELAQHIKALRDQFSFSEATLLESRRRYSQGLSDYLPVITALQSYQRLERDILFQTYELLVNRIFLYRALGGTIRSEFAANPKLEANN